MKIVSLRKIIQTAAYRVGKDQVADVPDDIAKNWIANKFARPATAAEAKAFEASKAKEPSS